VDQPRLPDVLAQPGDGAVKRHGGLPSELGDQAQRDRQPEQVAGDLLGRALTQPIAPGQQAEHGVQAGPKAPVGTPGVTAPQVEVPHRGQHRRWSRYSVTTGWTGGLSAT